MTTLYSIYRLNFPNGKYYIGQTKKNVKDRFIEHSWDRTNSKCNLHRPIIFAMRKYKGQVTFDILEQNLSPDEADFLEKYYIKYYNTTNIRCGYNISNGGNSGSILSEEGKQRRKEKMKQYYDNPDWVKQISNHFNDENIRINTQEKYQEYIKKYRNDVNARNKRAEIFGAKPFICIETGKIYYNMKLAAEELNCQQSNIWKVLNGQRNHTKNLTFKYIIEEK